MTSKVSTDFKILNNTGKTPLGRQASSHGAGGTMVGRL